MFRMLVVDVDGTLMGRSGHVTPRVRRAVRAALDAGVLVTLATGRWFRSAQPIAAELGLELPIILHNGALVRDSLTGEVLHQCRLPRALAVEALATIVRFGAQPIVYEGDGLLLAGPAELDRGFAGKYLATKTPVRRVADVAAALGPDDPIQLVVAEDAAVADPLIEELSQGAWRTVTSMSLAVPEARFVEVLAPECSKANAIRHLGERFGITLAETMAIGDNFNDLDMIEAAGLGVAMANAPAGVRARADWVAPHVDDDGLADAIERFLLLGEGAAPQQAGQDQPVDLARRAAGGRREEPVEREQEHDRLAGRPIGSSLDQLVDGATLEIPHARSAERLF
jgi:Cof subfamily protein (haloacid dehalogenase superfamily)